MVRSIGVIRRQREKPSDEAAHLKLSIARVAIMEGATAEGSGLPSQRTDSRLDDVASFGNSDVASSPLNQSTTVNLRRGQSHDTKSPTAAEDIETLRVVEGLEVDISGGDYISFLKELDNRSTGGITTSWEMEEKVVVEGFRLLRYHVLESQMSKPNVVVLTGEGWVKTIKSKFNAFENNRVIVVSGLLTFLTLSSLPGNYKNLIVRRGGIDCAMKMLDDHREDEEVCSLACALLLSLCLNEKEGLNATYGEITTMVKQLVSLISRGGYGSDFALRVLFQLTFHKKKLPDTAKSLSYLLKKVFREEENYVVALLNMMKNKSVRESTVEAAISLLWRLSVPKDNFDDDDLCLTSNDTIETVIAAMDSFDSIAIREAGCGILANISIRTDISAELAQKAFSSMQKFLLRIESVDDGLATCALHAICNMLEKPMIRTNLLLDRKLMETVIFLMGRFFKSEELIEFACLAIGRAARHDQAIKELFVALGAFELVMEAFEEFVTTRGDSPSLDVKDACLCAFATLTGCRSGAQAAISTGLIDIFTTLLAVETDRDFAVILDVIIANTRSCATNDGFSTSPEDTLRHEPHLFSKLMENAINDSDVSSLIQIMLGIHRTSLNIAFSSNEGFHVCLSAMTQWTNSVNVQESGCLLLAEIFFHLPYPIDAMDIMQGPWAAQNQRQTLNIVHMAMDSYPDNMNIQLNGCLAILNLLHPVSETGRESLDRQTISSVIELSYKVVLECLRVHGSDINLQKSGMSALAVSISVAQTEDFAPWATRIVQQLSYVLLHFTGNYPIQALALDALISIQETHATIKSEYSSSDINILLDLVGCNSNEISGRSLTILSSLLRNSPESSSQIMECHDYIERIISGVGSKREDLQIQLNIYSILHDLVTVRPDRCDVIAAMLCQHNGIHTLCMGITSHPQNRKMAMTLCKILSSIIPYLDANAIASSRDAIKFSLINGLENHIENPEVESSIFDVLCICCGHDDNFKGFLLEETRARMIINTMQFCLGCDRLQSSGCDLLSALSCYGSGKETIGNCGGIPVVVNALLAHNESAEVQKQGLIALKKLATLPVNKSILAETGAESTVIYALWIHYRDPEVVSIGLSALNNLAVDSVRKRVAKITEQVLTIVVTAMKTFSADELVQKNACFYLKTCSYLPENVGIMCDNSDVLLALLLQASDNFPETCSNRSAAVVAKITSYERQYN